MVSYRFPVKRLSANKQEPQETKIKKPARETLSHKVKESLRKKQQQEEEKEEEEVKEEVVSQSLQKRDKNIKENKAMVTGHCKTNWYCLYISLCCAIALLPLMTLLFFFVVSQLAKLFADLSTMADLPLTATPPVSINTAPHTISWGSGRGGRGKQSCYTDLYH